MAKRYYDEKYAGYDMRRAQERADGGMLSADNSKIANMPQEVKYMEYPKTSYYMNPALDDTIRGADRQMSEDVRGGTLKKGKYPEKY